MTQDTLVILGAGYLARFIAAFFPGLYTNLRFTSRWPDISLPHIVPEQRIEFDLARPETWENVPRNIDVLWTFPAAPLAAVQQFVGHVRGSFRRLVVLGSTSAYGQAAPSDPYPPPWIDETSAIDRGLPRVQGEEFLRANCAAVVLRVAGIYGPGRNPLDWIKQGRVRPSRKYVNLIHVEDLAAICLVALHSGIPGEVYNVSDGAPRTWEEIYQVVGGRRSVMPLGDSGDAEGGKRISVAKLRRELYPRFRHGDLYRALCDLSRSDRCPE